VVMLRCPSVVDFVDGAAGLFSELDFRFLPPFAGLDS